MIAGTDGNSFVRSYAIAALGKIGEPAVPALVEGLSSENGAVRKVAMNALGIIGPAAKDAVPALLVEASKDGDIDLRRRVAEVIDQIEGR